MGTIVPSSKYSNRLDWLVDKTICDTFHLNLNTKEKRTAVTVAFVVSYTLLPLVLYFGLGSIVMGSCIFAKGFAVTKMGALLIGASTIISLSLLAMNIYIVLRRNTPSPTTTIVERVLNPATVNPAEILPERKPLEKLVINHEELEKVFKDGKRSHQVFLEYINFPSSQKEKELRLSVVMTKLVNAREFEATKYLVFNIKNIDTPCIGKERKTLLVCALKLKELDLVNFLLVNKANPNQAYNENDTLLSFACKKAVSSRRMDLRFVKLLLNFGAEVEPHLFEEYSTYENQIGVIFIKTFLEYGKEPSKLACKNAAYHNLNILEIYLGRFPSILKNWGIEIFESAWGGNYRIDSINLLLKYGFNLQKIQKDIINDAVLHSDENLVKLLVSKCKLKVKLSHIKTANDLWKLVRKGFYAQDDYPIGRILTYLRKQYKRAGLLQRANSNRIGKKQTMRK